MAESNVTDSYSDYSPDTLRSYGQQVYSNRPIPDKVGILALFPQNVANAWQILYRTTNALGNAEATVTTILEPHNPDPTKLLSYKVAEDSASQVCAPSYVLQTGSGVRGITTKAEILLMDAALERGWYVNVPDYEGPMSSFTCGLQFGQATLDSIRAVLAPTNITKVHASARVALWGYSDGALASGWAAELQPTYAPELKIVGAALGGTPADLNATINAVNGGLFVGLVPAGILGLSQQYPDLSKFVQSQLIPKTKKAFNKAANQCLAQDIIQFAFQDVFKYFSNPIVLNEPIAIKALNDNKMGKYVPKIPLYMYHAINDEIVPFMPAQALVKKFCAKGSNIEFVKDELSEHAILAVTGAADAILWMTDRMNGKPAKKGCSEGPLSPLHWILVLFLFLVNLSLMRSLICLASSSAHYPSHELHNL
ncbi:putative secretory lipase [Umbelopsis sp. PMI_123]|nr:putative secretory lipase [Umbelopsis sp. PMI_123]